VRHDQPMNTKYLGTTPLKLLGTHWHPLKK